MHDSSKDINFDLNVAEHCYVLGFFWADCCFRFCRIKKCFEFSFEIENEDFLKIWPILQYIGFKKFSTRKRKNSKRKQSCVRSSKKETMKFFKKYFFHDKNKGCPLYFDIKKENKPFFIKGFLDGDGSISLDKNKLFRVSFNGNKNQSWDFLDDFCSINGIKYSIYRKDRKSKHSSHKKTTHGYSVFEFTDLQSRVNFCKLVDNLKVGVDRKIKVFVDFKHERLVQQEKNIFMKKLIF